VVPKFHSKQKKSALKTGDVVVSRVISNEVNAAVVPPELDGANCGNVLVIRPGHRLHPEYLVHLIGCPASQRALLGRQVGSAQAVINTSVLKAWHVPVLPLAEQRRIAEVLDRAEALRAKRRAALAQLDELTQAIFLDMFGDPMSNPKGVKVVRLADVSNRITDGVHQKPNYTDSGVAFISVKDITTGKLVFDDCKYISAEDHEKFTRRCKPERNDILYTKVGATYGRPAIVDTDREFSLYVSVCIIKPKRDLIDPHFLNAALGTSAVKGQADRRIKGIGVPDLHLDQIQSFLIPLPSMSEQHEFARRVTAVETLKTAHRASLAELDALFASLQHRAFRGEL
jgi:type I restriction enzyme S subunit